MDFLRYKISLTGTLVCTLLCMTVTVESNRLKRSDGQRVENRCQGVPGRDGRDGRDGIQGPYGPPGLSGNVGTSAEIERKFEELLASVTEKSSTAAGGTTYVRWGRNVCPPKTIKLYSGLVAGSHFTHAGSGANHMCLPMEPQWNRTVAGHQSGSYLYGTELELLESNSGFHRSNAGGKLQHNHEAQCAVCQTPGRLNKLMIPARLECPSGWNREYLGFLMSGHHTHKRSEYVCVDQDPDIHAATSANKDGNLFYPVEVVCGALPCPPYVEGYEVTCVVCTQ